MSCYMTFSKTYHKHDKNYDFVKITPLSFAGICDSNLYTNQLTLFNELISAILTPVMNFIKRIDILFICYIVTAKQVNHTDVKYAHFLLKMTPSNW